MSDENFAKDLLRKSTGYEVPKEAQWFKEGEIHEIEMQSLSEFFKGKNASKTPEIYKEYRNYILNLYRENPTTYLTATACRRHLSGDVCSILRIHAFLEFWGLINFNIDPSTKPINPLLPKAHNYKTPIFVDASSFLVKGENQQNQNNSNSNNGNLTLTNNNLNFGIKVGDNAVIVSSSNGEERIFYPINNNSELLFRSVFNKSTNSLNQINFIAKNFRPKCDFCVNLCELEWYSQILNRSNNDSYGIISNNLNILLCENCYKQNNYHKDLNQNSFEKSDFFHFVNPENKISIHKQFEKWNAQDIILLIDSIDQNGDNWEEITKVFQNRKTQADCVMQFIQLPIKENVQFKFNEHKNNISTGSSYLNNQREISSIYDSSNPLIGQVVFFAQMFEHFSKNQLNEETSKQMDIDSTNNQNGKTLTLENLQKEIYEKYSQKKSNKEKAKKEKNRMKNLMKLMIYLQIQKIEDKMSYYTEIEKMIKNEKMQLKNMDNQVISERINLVMKKNEMINMTQKLKEIEKRNEITGDYFRNFENSDVDQLINDAHNFKIDLGTRIMNLNKN